MADTPILPILPSGQVQSVSTGSGAQSATQIPTGAMTLPTGTVLTGFITGRDSRGNPILKTDKGTLALKNDFFIATGAKVVIRLETRGAESSARILSIDGMPPQKYQQQQQVPAALPDSVSEPLLASKQSAAAKPLNLPSNFIATNPLPLEAIITSTSPMLPKLLPMLPQALQPSLPQIVPGSTISVRLVATEVAPVVDEFSALLPDASTQAKTTEAPASTRMLYNVYAKQTGGFIPPANTPLPASTPNIQAEGAKTPTPTPATPALPNTITPTASPAISTTGATIPIPPVSVPLAPSIPAASNLPTPTTPSLPNATPESAVPVNTPSLTKGLMEGVIVGREKSGMAIIHTTLGTLKLDLPAPIPSGARIVLEITGFNPPSTIATSTSGTAGITDESSLVTLAKAWPNLAEAIHLIARHDPVLAQQVSERAIPNIGNQLSSGIVFFISALKGGNVRDWLGNKAADIIEQRGSHDLMGRISGEFSMLRSALTEAPNQQWQTLVFPFYHGKELQQARIFIRKDRDQEQTNQKETMGTRFIVEVDNKQFGELQLDGFVRKHGKSSNFDLMIRSLTAFPSQMQSDINGIFTSAAELTGFKGQLQFQTVKQFPVTPLEDITSSSSKLMA